MNIVTTIHIYRLALISLTCLTCASAFAHAPLRRNASVLRQTQVDGDSAPKSKLRSFPVISGIGAALSITPAGPKIGKIMPNSAAARSGKLHDGDLILAISENNQIVSLKGKPMGDVVSLIRGPVGTPVTLKIKSPRDKTSFFVTLTRAAVPLPGISYQRLVGKPAPNVQFTNLGKSSHVELSEYQGKIVVLDLWASWCSTCYASLDKMQKIARTHPEWKDSVALLAATIDTSISAALKVIKTRDWNETTFLSLTLQNLKAMKIETIPTLLIISPRGKIVAVGDPHAISIESQVSRLISRMPAVRSASADPR